MHNIAESAVIFTCVGIVMPVDGIDQICGKGPFFQNSSAYISMIGSKHDKFGNLKGNTFGNHCFYLLYIILYKATQNQFAHIV